MILLDTREFDHPIPLEMAVDRFKKLKGEEVIHMIHRREPIPLFEIITKNGGRYLSVMERDDLWHIYITRSPTLALEHTDV
ncbi:MULTISPECIES: DUF2249 domain-containing protein [unclassified Sulfuricurvum]|uniref:DUF2249 domain-containing protein n=1 Tax=unclassified Sulfuricurvum TaxID=2632390 RepID=UPI0002997A78|nr:MULTISPECIES: DUF2249 domain-containing protein [unclassified Sulfuricurvum]OHD82917.1 MAG: hypothetical protein A3D90_04045 [Sulfuricurvum sp. RIFCSPHIGHO2_02_FULL_43_9]OHD86513.1 MAG: hypothetical protein A3I60_05335 [Sulfuricurvum sp. RIFCSPLOWO2_02_FULL_43_45]OHD87513.1 MAG: hypothetical protein A2W83_00405 [Sulfuricurvum sp. RIFCSPLOWO2_12_43_5]AFV96373.1 hypothetical protein B649_00295 [Candidatus Sulfuricurvum sp. RIFRC-1]OHD88969.1 MAG: hypothetical protein A3G19_06605 [Sulfuricurvu